MAVSVRVAVDAMGGDDAPIEIVLGVLSAAPEYPDTEYHLFGDQNSIQKIIDDSGLDASRVLVHHTSQVVTMAESPVKALKSKPDSSLFKAVQFVKSGGADIFFGAGNTGATVAASQISFRLIKGVFKPGIMTYMPTMKKPILILDVGANIHPKKEHLIQYAIIGSLYAKEILGVENPRIGLLNIGEEAGKGNELVKEVHTFLSEADLNFIGNIEPSAIYKGDTEVIVTDGFTGNVLLKSSEGMGEAIFAALERSCAGSDDAKAMEELVNKALFQMTYKHFGGAPLLGLEKLTIIGHGCSDRIAVKSAMRIANEFVTKHLSDKIREQIAAMPVAVG